MFPPPAASSVRRFARVPSLHVSRKLTDIVKLPLLQKESAPKVREIWLSHDKPRIINGAIARQEWDALSANSRAAPLFVVPVYPDEDFIRSSRTGTDLSAGADAAAFGVLGGAGSASSATEMTSKKASVGTILEAKGIEDGKSTRAPAAGGSSTCSTVSNSGYYNLVSEWQGDEIVLTFLEDYQKNHTDAVPFLVVNFFQDLLESHNVVLLRADIVSGNLTKKQGQLAIRFLREAYTHLDRFEWVKKFNFRPREFDYKKFENWCVGLRGSGGQARVKMAPPSAGLAASSQNKILLH
ncbi:unnamed protein product [Amoebophrya sp. A25]|nr:unnamed protein product [Amoebophrya sp. A25]|eukprot:GSA25T00021966001.1